jgi:uncharacterized protein
MVDEEDLSGKVILTGSQQFIMMKNVSQSLAGRTAIVTLLPFSLKETQLIKNIEDTNEILF